VAGLVRWPDENATTGDGRHHEPVNEYSRSVINSVIRGWRLLDVHVIARSGQRRSRREGRRPKGSRQKGATEQVADGTHHRSLLRVSVADGWSRLIDWSAFRR